MKKNNKKKDAGGPVAGGHGHKAADGEMPIRLSMAEALGGEDAGGGGTLPFTVAGGDTPPVAPPSASLGILDENGIEYVTPWILLVNPIIRVGEQMVFQFGNQVVTVRIDTDKAEANGWRAQHIVEAMHAQTLLWLRHCPEAGLSICVEQVEEKGGG
jgi:hypothetical protein